MDMDGRPGNRIKPDKPEPEYATRPVPIRGETSDKGDRRLLVDLMVCTRCGCYVWDLQAHEDYHR